MGDHIFQWTADDMMRHLVAGVQQYPNVEKFPNSDELYEQFDHLKSLICEAARTRLISLQYDSTDVHNFSTQELRGVVLSDRVAGNLRRLMNEFFESLSSYF